MSRPFSYNDENFTVIGNVLFCHILIKKRVYAGKSIVDIPPKIYDHMLFFSNRLYKLQPSPNVASASTVDVAVRKDGKDCYLFCNNDIYETGLYLIGYFILKDI